MLLKQLTILRQHLLGDRGLQDSSGFQIHNLGISQQTGFCIQGVVQLNDVQIKPAETQLIKPRFKTVGVEQVAEYNGDSGTRSAVQKLTYRFLQTGFVAIRGEGLEELHEGQDSFTTASERKLLNNSGGTGYDRDAIEVCECDPGECGGELTSQFEFTTIGKAHTARTVEQQPDVQVLFFLKPSDQQVTVPGIDVPVEIPEVFAGAVFAMVGEFDTGPCLASSALSQQLSAKYPFRHDRKVFEACQEIGRKQHGAVCRGEECRVISAFSGGRRSVHLSHNATDHVIRADAFRLSFKIQDNAMTQYRECHLLQVCSCDMTATVQNRSNLRPKDQCLQTTRAGPITNIATGSLR